MIATPVYNNLAAYVDLFGMKSEQGKILTIEKQKTKTQKLIKKDKWATMGENKIDTFFFTQNL